MPSGATARDLTLLSAVALVVVIVSVVGAIVEPPPTDGGIGSTYGASAHGAKAAYLALKRLGYRVERVFDPLADLVVDPESTLLVIASPELPTSGTDSRMVQRFVEAGGIVLAAGHVDTLLPHLRTTRLPLASPFTSTPPTTFAATSEDPLTSGIESITMAPEASASPSDGSYGVIFGERSRPGMMAASIGTGRVIWLSGSDPLLNKSVTAPGHVELLLNALGPPGARRVIWSEYYHGHGRSLWSYLAHTPAPAALLQVSAVAAIALATFGRRRGPVRPLVPEPRVSVLEFVDALAGLYRKAGAAAGAVEIALARVRRLLSVSAGLPAGSSDEAIASATASRLGLDRGQLVTTLGESAAAAGAERLSSTSAMALVHGLQAVAAANGSAVIGSRHDARARPSRQRQERVNV